VFVYVVAMRLHINGEDKDFPELSSLAELVDRLGAKADRLAIELNRNIVPRRDWDSTPLKDGDSLEIVHFVGGGSR
jgi:thiamine biosynthesis protein ThiS